MLDLITIGDATIDTHIKIHDGEILVDKNHREPRFCIPWGTKIPVDSLDHQVGGNSVNVAVGASRLGVRVAIYVNLGSDEGGKKILKKLEEEKVATEFVNVEVGMQSNYSAVLSFHGERTIFVYHQKWYYELPQLPEAQWVYLSSCGENFSRGGFIDQLVDLVTARSLKLAYNPGTYQLRADVKEFPQLLKVCNLFVVNHEEARRILEIDPNIDVEMKKLLAGLKNLGPKKVVITDGELGSYSYDGDQFYFAPKFKTETVQAVGAGDAYGSGLIAALIHGYKIDAAMVWGALNSAAVVAKIGSQKGLLTEFELLKIRSKHPDFNAKEV